MLYFKLIYLNNYIITLFFSVSYEIKQNILIFYIDI
jgi:hypothetical protein